MTTGVFSTLVDYTQYCKYFLWLPVITLLVWPLGPWPGTTLMESIMVFTSDRSAGEVLNSKLVDNVRSGSSLENSSILAKNKHSNSSQNTWLPSPLVMKLKNPNHTGLDWSSRQWDTHQAAPEFTFLWWPSPPVNKEILNLLRLIINWIMNRIWPVTNEHSHSHSHLWSI